MLLILETLWFLLFFSFQSAKWSVTGDRTGALIFCEWSTIQCICICLNIFFFLSMHLLLRTADILLSSSVLVVSFFFKLPYLDFSFFVLWILSSCLSKYFTYWFLDARDISFAALRLSGERSHFVLVFPRVSFSRCRAGEWTNDKIPYHGESAYISHCRDVIHFRDALHSLLHDQILSNVHVSADISK